MKKIAESVINQIVPMYEAGYTYREIADKLGISHVTVGRIVRNAGLDRYHVGGRISKSLPLTNDRLPEPQERPSDPLLVTGRTLNIHGIITGCDYVAGTHMASVDIMLDEWALSIDRNKLSGFIAELENIRKLIGAR